MFSELEFDKLTLKIVQWQYRWRKSVNDHLVHNQSYQTTFLVIALHHFVTDLEIKKQMLEIAYENLIYNLIDMKKISKEFYEALGFTSLENLVMVCYLQQSEQLKHAFAGTSQDQYSIHKAHLFKIFDCLTKLLKENPPNPPDILVVYALSSHFKEIIPHIKNEEIDEEGLALLLDELVLIPFPDAWNLQQNFSFKLLEKVLSECGKKPY